MIPSELYRVIVGFLDPEDDRVTLLSVAHCSTTFGEESQRILFESTSGKGWSQSGHILRHKFFLRAVLGSPRRLALYVKDFAQYGIGWQPGCRSDRSKADPNYEVRAEVYTATMLALPTMINLRRLRYCPMYAQPSAQILLRCMFQLHVLEWLQPACENDLCLFLSSQEELRHVTLPSTFHRQGMNDILPKLVSVQGDLPSLVALKGAKHRGQILAFDFVDRQILHQSDTEHVAKALSGIQCLRVPDVRALLRLLKLGPLPTILMVEVAFWFTKELDFLYHLPPNLRTLVLQQFDHGGDLLMQFQIENTASIAFNRCISLKYVEFRPIDSARGFRVVRPAKIEGAIRISTHTFSDHPTEWWKRPFSEKSDKP